MTPWSAVRKFFRTAFFVAYNNHAKRRTVKAYREYTKWARRTDLSDEFMSLTVGYSMALLAELQAQGIRSKQMIEAAEQEAHRACAELSRR